MYPIYIHSSSESPLGAKKCMICPLASKLPVEAPPPCTGPAEAPVSTVIQAGYSPSPHSPSSSCLVASQLDQQRLVKTNSPFP